MAEDLYSLWLAMPAGARPPDHYALLGVPRFCDDVPAIETATRRQLRQLDKYAIHPDRAKRAACAAMMNEVARARVCLTHAQRKRAYDESLGRRFADPAAPSRVAAAAGGPPAPKVVQPPQPMPARSAMEARAEFQQEARQHLHQWMLNDHEMRLLLATADSMGLAEKTARRIIRRVDAEADEAAQQASRRWNYVLVGAAVAAVLVVLAAIFPPAWLRSLGDALRPAPQAPKVESAGRQNLPPASPGPAAPVTPATPLARIRLALDRRQYAEIPALMAELRATGGAVEAEGLVGDHVAQLWGELTRQLADRQWTQAAGTARALGVLRPEDPAPAKLIAHQTTTLILSAANSGDAAAARRDIAAALELSPTHSLALWVAKDIDRKFGKATASGLATRKAPSTSPAVERPRPEVTGPPKDLTLDLGGGVSMRLVLIPAGKFTMGSPEPEQGRSGDEGPQREVTITKPFYLGVFEVTQEQYEQVMGKNPSRFKGGQNPVDSVSWDSAVEFCKKLSQKTGKTVSLPTEAQWEYACRAGSKTRFHFGDNDADLGEYAWYSDSRAHPRGQKKPNAFGLYDMHGNVWEWCADRYGVSYAKAENVDPLGPDSGTYRVLRGGSWVNDSPLCRSAYRQRSDPGNRGSALGFRVAVELGPGPSTSPSATRPGPAPRPPPVAPSAQEQAAERLELPLDSSLDLGNGVTMKLVLIPPGKFMMGSSDDRSGDEGPQREVKITKPFYLGVFEVTQEQYEQVMGENPSRFRGAQNPVESVSWDDAASFCKKLSQKTGQTVSLPTEAQWEYACRAGSKTRFGRDDSNASFGDYAWYEGNSASKTHPVGGKKPNAFGLCDMLGNVWEWCGDWYGPYGRGDAEDPKGPSAGTTRVWRGGSWFSSPGICYSAYRNASSPGSRVEKVGLRVAVELGSGPSTAPSATRPGPASRPAAPQAMPAPVGPRAQQQAAVRVGLPLARSLDLGNGVPMKLVLIPPGKFMMGSPDKEQGRGSDEGPQREVTITSPFYMGVFEVTQEQYEQVMGKNPSRLKGVRNPVDTVAWNDAVEFCKKLSEKTGKKVRLPTEAEWEYACRAGTKTKFGFGNDDTDLRDYGWYSANSESKSHPVGQKKHNAWGLYDMHGNVWEWCGDRYAESYANAKNVDPAGPDSGGFRVLRGGSWHSGPECCRSAIRFGLGPVYRFQYGGFRVAVGVD